MILKASPVLTSAPESLQASSQKLVTRQVGCTRAKPASRACSLFRSLGSKLSEQTAKVELLLLLGSMLGWVKMLPPSDLWTIPRATGER